MRFDFRFKQFEVLTDAAFVHATQFTVNPVNIGKNDEAHAESRDSQYIKK
jgi:hypothetical protein